MWSVGRVGRAAVGAERGGGGGAVRSGRAPAPERALPVRGLPALKAGGAQGSFVIGVWPQ